jgi:S1-C subfamily serine protease
MKRNIFLVFGIIGIFCLGSLGGLWTQAFLLPYVSSQPAFQEWQFVKEWNERATVIREVQEITISSEESTARVAEKAKDAIVGIVSTGVGEAVYGSGFIVTSDGFIITLADVIPAGYKAFVYRDSGGDALSAKVLKRDTQKNLAILKIEESNLSTVGFASANSMQIGSSVVMVAKAVEGNSLVLIAQEGSVRTTAGVFIRTNIFDKPALQGSPLFDLNGQIAGLSTFEAGGRLVAIPASALRDFSGF